MAISTQKSSAIALTNYLKANERRELSKAQELYLLAGGYFWMFPLSILGVAIVVPRFFKDLPQSFVLIVIANVILSSISFWPLLKRNLKIVSLIRTGTFSHAKVDRGKEVFFSMKMLNGKQRRYHLNFEDERGTLHTAEDRSYLHKQVTDDEEELILYDARDPTHAVLIDGISQKLRVNEDKNQIEVNALWGPLALLPFVAFVVALAMLPFLL